MRNLLAEAVAELHLEPGQTYRATVGDVEVQLHRPVEPKPAGPAEEPSRLADMVMLDPWIDLGAIPSPDSVTVIAKFGPLPLPDPPIIPPDYEVTE